MHSAQSACSVLAFRQRDELGAPPDPTHCPHLGRCVGGLGLSVVCRLLAEDYSGWRGGAPDLLLWRPKVGDARVSEVKVGLMQWQI